MASLRQLEEECRNHKTVMARQITEWNVRARFADLGLFLSKS